MPSSTRLQYALKHTATQVQLERQGKKSKSGSQLDSKKTKKADRMELQLKEQVTKALASLRLKQAVVVSISPRGLFMCTAHLAFRFDGLTATIVSTILLRDLLAADGWEPVCVVQATGQQVIFRGCLSRCKFLVLLILLLDLDVGSAQCKVALNDRYDGVLMAKLPFEPPSLVRKLSQRGLTDPKADDCAFVSLSSPRALCANVPSFIVPEVQCTIASCNDV